MTKKDIIRPNQTQSHPVPTNAYGPIDNDLALDNLANDLPLADLQDL